MPATRAKFPSPGLPTSVSASFSICLRIAFSGEGWVQIHKKYPATAAAMRTMIWSSRFTPQSEKKFSEKLISGFQIAVRNCAIVAEKKILIRFERVRAAVAGVALGFVRFVEMFAVDENFAAGMDRNGFSRQSYDSFEDERVVFISVKRHDIAAFRLVPFTRGRSE